MQSGFWKNMEAWFSENDVFNKVFRIWYNDADADETCDFVFIYQAVQLADGDYLLGVRSYDDSYDDKMYPSINYVRLSKVEIAYYEGDQDETEAE